jgi:alpha-tubulin suppressor-like RCC1 family protein
MKSAVSTRTLRSIAAIAGRAPALGPRWLSSIAFFVLGSGLAGPLSAQTLSPLQDIAQLAVGDGHACALTVGGGVKCWGNNENGQLGDNSVATRYLPVDVVGLGSGVVSISAGYRHTCAVTTTGGVKCWGKNLLGQLGDGTTLNNRRTPVDVVGIVGGTVAISAGGDHTCALDSGGMLRCWGFNGDGQLGIGSTSNQSTPAAVVGGTGAAAVTTGYANTCSLSTTGAVKCWGVYDRICNIAGCGFSFHTTPTNVAGLGSGVAAVSAGEFFNCALTTAGAVKCWGDNYDGQLGVLGTTDPDPLQLFAIDGLQSGVVQVSAGDDHACARLSDETLRCWGSNAQGRLGDGSNSYRFPPVAVSGLSGVSQVGAGGGHTCARTFTGRVHCWGDNSSGQLGDGDPWFRLTPTAVPGLASGTLAISAGEFHSCALTTGGTVKCWGANNSGRLGDGTTVMRPTPVDVIGLAGSIARISAGASHSCAVSVAGAVSCWGSNASGQLGNGGFVDQLTPAPVPQLSSGVADVDAGFLHTCARTLGGGARCWGANSDSQLGDGSLATQVSPVNVFGLGSSGVNAISAGGYHSCAVGSGGSILCWGSGRDGQIGNGGTSTQFTPTTLTDPSQGVTAISAGSSHTCALTAGGEALCWGDNDEGQVGNGTAAFSQLTPNRVLGLGSGVARISAGLRHSCVTTSAGAALCWGYNLFGQLGDGSTTRRTSPVGVAGLSTGVTRVEAGGYHSCALSTAGAVSCWGDNSSGQLGIGRRDNRLPGPVLAEADLFRSGFESGESPRPVE